MTWQNVEEERMKVSLSRGCTLQIKVNCHISLTITESDLICLKFMISYQFYKILLL